MRRSHRQSLVVWSSSGVPARGPSGRGPGRARRVRRGFHTSALLAVLGLTRIARAVRVRPRLGLLLAGAALAAAGIMLPSGVSFIGGMLVLLRGVAVTLGVSEPRRRRDGEPAGAADFFGFGTPPFGGSFGPR
jgi:hypothetical protein